MRIMHNWNCYGISNATWMDAVYAMRRIRFDPQTSRRHLHIYQRIEAAAAADCGRAYSIYSECSYHHWQRKSTHEASSILQFTIDITQTGSVRHIDLFYHKMSVSSLACRHERTAVAHVLCCFILYVQKPSKSTRNAMNLKWQAKQ